MYTNLAIANFNKDEFIEYIQKYLVNGIKLNADDIGKFIVMQTREVEKQFVPLFGIVTSRYSHNIIWAAFEIGWYNRQVFKDNDYKSHLKPIGVDWAIAEEHDYYNDDIESRLNRHDALIVDDPMEAADIARKLNELNIEL